VAFLVAVVVLVAIVVAVVVVARNVPVRSSIGRGVAAVLVVGASVVLFGGALLFGLVLLGLSNYGDPPSPTVVATGRASPADYDLTEVRCHWREDADSPAVHVTGRIVNRTEDTRPFVVRASVTVDGEAATVETEVRYASPDEAERWTVRRPAPAAQAAGPPDPPSGSRGWV
jgi:hypothetical protein